MNTVTVFQTTIENATRKSSLQPGKVIKCFRALTYRITSKDGVVISEDMYDVAESIELKDLKRYIKKTLPLSIVLPFDINSEVK